MKEGTKLLCGARKIMKTGGILSDIEKIVDRVVVGPTRQLKGLLLN